jgi:hypothetical protein
VGTEREDTGGPRCRSGVDQEQAAWRDTLERFEEQRAVGGAQAIVIDGELADLHAQVDRAQELLTAARQALAHARSGGTDAQIAAAGAAVASRAADAERISAQADAGRGQLAAARISAVDEVLDRAFQTLESGMAATRSLFGFRQAKPARTEGTPEELSSPEA